MYELEVRCDDQVPRMGGGGAIPKIGIWWVVRLVGKIFSFRQGKISCLQDTHRDFQQEFRSKCRNWQGGGGSGSQLWKCRTLWGQSV